MVELDYDEVLTELKKLPTIEQNDVPEMLEHFLQKVAKNGEVVYSWDLVKPLFIRKLEAVMDAFSKNHPMPDDQLKPPNCQKFIFEDCKKNILTIFGKFNEPPFTTQRLSEILVEPGKHYRRLDKLMRGIERNVLVVSPLPPMQENYWDDYQKESAYKDLYTNCSLSNSFKAAFEENDDVEPSELINDLENCESSTGNGSASYESSSSYSMTNSQPQQQSSTFYDHHIQQGPGGQQNSSMLVELQSASEQHVQPASGLAPLQQLDSFTNVFASNSSTHLTHLSTTSGSSTTYSLESSTISSSSSTWSATGHHHHHHLKGPYEDVIQPDDQHGDGDENIIVDDEEDDDEEDGIDKEEDEEGKEKEEFFYNESQQTSEVAPPAELSVNTDLPNDDVPSHFMATASQQQSAVDDEELSLENALKKRLSPTPIPEEEVEVPETDDSLTPKKIKIAENSPEVSSESSSSCSSDNASEPLSADETLSVEQISEQEVKVSESSAAIIEQQIPVDDTLPEKTSQPEVNASESAAVETEKQDSVEDITDNSSLPNSNTDDSTSGNKAEVVPEQEAMEH